MAKTIAKLDSSSLDAAIKYMGSLVTLKEIILAPTEKGYCIFGSEGGSQVRIEMPPGGVDLNEPIKIAVDIFQKAVAGRKDMTISVNRGVLSIRAKGYSADLSIMEVSEATSITPEAESKEIKFTAGTWAWFSHSVQALQLEPMAGMELNFMGKVTAKSVITAVFDSAQMAFQTAAASEMGSAEFEILLPYDRISRVLRGLPFDSTKILIGSGGMYVVTKRLRAFLPAIAEDGVVTVEDVVDKAKQITKLEGSRVELSSEALRGFLSNAASISNGTAAAVSFKESKGKVFVKASSSSGIVRSSLEGACATPFALDYRFLLTLTNKIKEKISIIVTDQMAVAKAVSGDSKIYLVTALQEDSGAEEG